MRFFRRAVTALALLGITLPTLAQIPVTDVAGLAQAIETVRQQASMLLQLKAQLEAQIQQIEALTQVRNLKDLLGLKDIESLIDPSALQALKQLESAGVSEIGIVNSQRLHKQATKAAAAIDKRKTDIDRMIAAASATQDAKASADLTARAAAMNTALLNEMLYQMELQKAAAAKNILDEYKLRQESYSHYTSGRANPFQLKRP